MQVQDLDVDVIDFLPNFEYNKTDIQISHEFIDEKHWKVDISITNTDKIFPEIELCIYYRTEKISQMKTIELQENKGTTIMESPCLIYASKIPRIVYPKYSLVTFPSSTESINRDEFNNIFSSEIYYDVPDNIYVIGVLHSTEDSSRKVYYYNPKYQSFYEINSSIQFIVQVFLTFFSPQKYPTFYFLICADDGYMEHHYSSGIFEKKPGRSIPKIADYSQNRRIAPGLLQENEYAVLHREKWIFGMSNLLGVPYTIDAIDRHYFYCNRYHPFRSFHRGIPFSHKINKIVYGCRVHNSTHFNFLQYRDEIGEQKQREYFYTDAVSKENIVAEKGAWIDSHEMRKYKYILDMDGNGCTWDATAWKLNSGSVILKTESGWRQWFYDKYLPWVHYVPIADDFSDLQEKYHWCESNPDKCIEIVNSAKDLFQEIYTFSNVVEYMREIIRSRILE
jgi:hypothetical protein